MKNKILSPRDFLEEAIKTVDQRGIDNGYDAGQERSAAKIAQVFNAVSGKDLTEEDVWTLLICLKLVRNHRKFKIDNIVDLAGYASLLGECQHNASQTEKTDGIVTFDMRVGGLSPWPDMKDTTGTSLDEFGEVIKVSRRVINGDAESDNAYRQRMLAFLNGDKPDSRPRTIIYVAQGNELDMYGRMLKTPRRQAVGVTGPIDAVEDDKTYRQRLLITAEHANVCLHTQYEDWNGGTYCLNCKELIKIIPCC